MPSYGALGSWGICSPDTPESQSFVLCVKSNLGYVYHSYIPLIKAMTTILNMLRDVLTQEEYFMAVAMNTARRSPDPVLQVGACVVDSEGRIRSVGYNKMPQDDNISYPWVRENVDPVQVKRFYICHAEENAIIQHPGIPKGSSIYVTAHPCNQCAKLIVLSGIQEVVYKDNFKINEPKYQAAKFLLKKSGVKVRQYKPTGKQLLCKL